jgi:hypothetical protein
LTKLKLVEKECDQRKESCNSSGNSGDACGIHFYSQLTQYSFVMT